MTSKTMLNRRTVLKGLGTTLALPLLNSVGWAKDTEGKESKPPVRLASCTCRMASSWINSGQPIRKSS